MEIVRHPKWTGKESGELRGVGGRCEGAGRSGSKEERAGLGIV